MFYSAEKWSTSATHPKSLPIEHMAKVVFRSADAYNAWPEQIGWQDKELESWGKPQDPSKTPAGKRKTCGRININLSYP